MDLVSDYSDYYEDSNYDIRTKVVNLQCNRLLIDYYII